MWRVQRLDQINAFKRANLFEFKSLTLEIQSEQIGPFKTAIRSEVDSTGKAAGCSPHARDCGLPQFRRPRGAYLFLHSATFSGLSHAS